MASLSYSYSKGSSSTLLISTKETPFFSPSYFIGVMMETFHQSQQKKSTADKKIEESQKQGRATVVSEPQQMPFDTHTSPHVYSHSVNRQLPGALQGFPTFSVEHLYQPRGVEKITDYIYFLIPGICGDGIFICLYIYVSWIK